MWDILKCKLKRHNCKAKICVNEFSILSAYVANFLLVESDAHVTNVKLLNPYFLTMSTPLSPLSHDNSSEIYRASSGTSRECAYLNITDIGVGQVSLSGCVSPCN